MEASAPAARHRDSQHTARGVRRDAIPPLKITESRRFGIRSKLLAKRAWSETIQPRKKLMNVGETSLPFTDLLPTYL